MFTGRQLRAWTVLVVSGIGLATTAGCGDDTGLGTRYSVSGTVTYNGTPLEKGQITFEPVKSEGSSRAANGVIEKGSYSLTTATPGDGALPGEYKVKIVAKEVDDSKVRETIAQKGGGGRQLEIAKATKAAKNLIPAKYQLTETSQLTATVKEQSNTFDFDLKD